MKFLEISVKDVEKDVGISHDQAPKEGKMSKRCKWFGHKWLPIVFRKRGYYKFLGCYCERCMYGYYELIDFNRYLKPDICAYKMELFKEPSK